MVKPSAEIFKNVLKNIFIRDLKLNKVTKKYEIVRSDLKNEKIPNIKILTKMKYIYIKEKIDIF